jgi:GNAT superfamily N-acetyltransferase
MTTVVVERLFNHPSVLPTLVMWFKAEWPAWYGPDGKGSAEADLDAYANQGSLPVGVVAFHRGAVCGAAALKANSIPSHTHLAPWAAAGFVQPSLRGQGIGAILLAALESEAKALGYTTIYCGTSTARSLLARARWRHLESVQLEGKEVGVYQKAL